MHPTQYEKKLEKLRKELSTARKAEENAQRLKKSIYDQIAHLKRQAYQEAQTRAKKKGKH